MLKILVPFEALVLFFEDTDTGDDDCCKACDTCVVSAEEEVVLLEGVAGEALMIMIC